MKRPKVTDNSGSTMEEYVAVLNEYIDHLEDQKILLIKGLSELIRYDVDDNGGTYTDPDGYYLHQDRVEELFSSIKPEKPTYKAGDTIIITGNMIDDCQYHGLDIGGKHRVISVHNDYEVKLMIGPVLVSIFNKDIKHAR